MEMCPGKQYLSFFSSLIHIVVLKGLDWGCESLWTETENVGSWGRYDIFQNTYLYTNYGLVMAIFYDKTTVVTQELGIEKVMGQKNKTLIKVTILINVNFIIYVSKYIKKWFNW